MTDYKTICESVESSFTEKKSEFIGHLAPVESEESAEAFIRSVKEANRKANHNVYAYILRHNNLSKYSDDGEPQGTAGAPVRQVLEREGLIDVCCVVTRYFGGVLLGASGLTRAYANGASIAVRAAKILVMRVCRKVTASMEYTLYGKVSHTLAQLTETVRVLDSRFETGVELELLVKSYGCDEAVKTLTEVCNGQIQLAVSDEFHCDFP